MWKGVFAAVLACAGGALGQGYVCAEGGGISGKGAWAKEIFGWMVEKGGKGPVVIIGAVKVGDDERLGIFSELGVASVDSLVIDGSNAAAPGLHERIAAASVVFIRGGAQDRYVRAWKDTGVAAAIVGVWKKGGVVGGTSAGCAVLGEVVFDATHGSLSPRDALMDARHPDLTLTTGFLGLAPGVLFDTHFTERARLGRLPVMIAVAHEDLKKDVLGIGVDPRTAACIGPDGIAEVRGEGTATFVALGERSRVEVERGTPPTVTGVAYTQLCEGYRYDLAKRAVVARPEGVRALQSAPGALDLPLVKLTVDAADERAADGGALVCESEPGAWLNGGLRTRPGRGILRQFVLRVTAWGERPADALAGVETALADHPGLIGVWLSLASSVRVVPGGMLDALEPAKQSTVVLDARGATHAGRGPEPRRAPVIEGAVLHVLAPGWGLDLTDGAGVPPERPVLPEPVGMGRTPD